MTSKANGKSAREALRLLYSGSLKPSREAEEALTRAGIDFVRFQIEERESDSREEPQPPCLIAGEGRFSGLERIKRYAEIFGNR